VLARQGRTKEAIAEFRTAVDVNPRFTPAYNNLAEGLVTQGKLDEAEMYYRRSVAEKPSAAVHNALGIVLSRLGKGEEAAEQFARANAMDFCSLRDTSPREPRRAGEADTVARTPTRPSPRRAGADRRTNAPQRRP
jgi:tetratricopeptide (TPR) repeat protein